MWAAGNIRFGAALKVGDEVRPAGVLMVRGQVRPEAALEGEALVVAHDVEVWG